METRQGHWRKKREATSRYREDCGWLVKEALPGVSFPNGVTLSYEFFQARPPVPDGLATFRDCDNALGAMKPAQDALIDAGLIPDDSARYVSIGSVVVHSAAESKGTRGVVMSLKAKEQP